MKDTSLSACEISLPQRAKQAEAESRRIQLTAFRQAIDERLGSLNAGESANGEEVMARLIAEIGEHSAIPGAR